MSIQETVNIFKNDNQDNLTEAVSEEIENNLKEYFGILLEWIEGMQDANK